MATKIEDKIKEAGKVIGNNAKKLGKGVKNILDCWKDQGISDGQEKI